MRLSLTINLQQNVSQRLPLTKTSQIEVHTLDTKVKSSLAPTSTHIDRYNIHKFEELHFNSQSLPYQNRTLSTSKTTTNSKGQNPGGLGQPSSRRPCDKTNI